MNGNGGVREDIKSLNTPSGERKRAFPAGLICVSIGEDSVIGAHAIMTHDIPAHSIAVGVPAKVKRRKQI